MAGALFGFQHLIAAGSDVTGRSSKLGELDRVEPGEFGRLCRVWRPSFHRKAGILATLILSNTQASGGLQDLANLTRPTSLLMPGLAA